MGRRADLRAIGASITMLTRVANSRRAHRNLADLAGVPLGPTTIGTLAAVSDLGPVRHVAVARRTRLQASRVSKEVRVLVDLGYVSECVDLDDRRAVVLEITERGTEALLRHRHAVERALAATLGTWTDDEIRHLRSNLARLAHDFAFPEADGQEEHR
jgi:DNA-binding MarR family transcriptional regulator